MMDHDHMDMGHAMSSMDHNVAGMTHNSMGGAMNMGDGHMMHMGNFKKKFWLSLVVAVPIFIFSPFMGLQLPFQFTFPGSDWLVLILASFLFFYGGQPFLSGAKGELKDKAPAMMTLISMGISVAYLYSLYAFIANHFINPSGHVMDFFWELASLIVIMLLGHWIEMNAVMNAGNALEKMAALLPGMVHLVAENGQTKDIELHDLKEGQQVLVQAGEKVPADGDVIEGNSSVNESLVTGEAKAVTKTNGDRVIGGSVNGNGTLTIKVTGTGETGYLAQVMKLVNQAQQEQSRAEGMAEKVAKYLFYAALSVGIVAFFVWLGIGGPDTALERMVTVLVIACPHALGVAIPLVVARSTSIAATNGLLIRDRHAIETAKKIDTVLMDKTGTLTEGTFKVNQVKALQKDISEEQVLQLFASLEANSSHPLATGILTAAKDQQVQISEAKRVEAVQGVGLNGEINGQKYSIVTANYLEKENIEFDQIEFDELASKGNSVSYLVNGGQVLGLIAQGDQIKSEARSFVSQLHEMGIQPVMLTGDNEPAAKQVAAQLGDITVRANLKPEDKERIVREFQSDNHQVMMVGDGINDAPSLARANIGVAIGAGTDVAIDSADVILVKSNPNDILNFLNLARTTNRKMVQNLWWGAGYNIIAIPLAAGVLAGIGIILSPAVGALVMSLSTIIVALNAMTLKM
ncbi:heavy metal translocating P-type ATPase [Paucilactobacillus kaifaensis]|uniref:heavy metal translocating P-type ATPase n=1 Tax=Paucilactobacillus kaifaensis TaxID=2559921 RepID=UPI0010F89E17